MKPFSPRTLMLSYLCALLIVAGLSLASHLMLNYGLQSGQGGAAVINFSGRQRMLSQRIASLAAQYRLGDLGAREELAAAVDAFEAAHAALVAASRANTSGDAAARQLHTLYFGVDSALDGHIRNFISDARRVTTLAPDDTALAPLLSRLFAQARWPLLKALDEVVTIQQQDGEARSLSLQHMQWAVLGVVLLTLLLEAFAIFRPMVRRISAYAAEMLRLEATDPLTGLANRRDFLERCEGELERARRAGRPTSLLMLDLDRFKSINDRHGHAAGDAALQTVAQIMRRDLRPGDICGRLGGEEFAILLADTDLAAAAGFAEQLRLDIAGLEMAHEDTRITFTVSVGVTLLTAGGAGLAAGLGIADSLLHEAKKAGRNRVMLSARPFGERQALSAPF